MSEFWDQKHKANSKLWLTCTKPEEVFQIHGIQLPAPDTRILDIGIGNGDMHRYLVALGHNVWSEDISLVALKKVRPGRGIRESEIHLHGPWDLVLCHLVLQHMNDKQIKRLLSQIYLTKTGIMSLQFAELLDSRIESPWPNHFFRDLETMERIVLDTGFRIQWIRNPTDWLWNGETIRWWVTRIKQLAEGVQ